MVAVCAMMACFTMLLFRDGVEDCEGGDARSSLLPSMGCLREFNGRDERVGGLVGPLGGPSSFSSSDLNLLLSVTGVIVALMTAGIAVVAAAFFAFF